jgi:cytoskeletal protein RodZ
VFKVRRLRILLACCVALAVGVGVATQAIGASTPTGTAETATATDPFAGYQAESGRPLLSDASLAKIATTEAARAGNASPASVSAADASYAQAAQAVDPQSVPNTKPSSAGQAQYMDAAAVVVTMTGGFTLTTARVPNNAKPPSGPVMLLVLDARTGRVEMRGIKEEVPPQVAALGSTRTLSAGSSN